MESSTRSKGSYRKRRDGVYPPSSSHSNGKGWRAEVMSNGVVSHRTFNDPIEASRWVSDMKIERSGIPENIWNDTQILQA